MQIETLSHPKYRTPGQAGDDVPLVVPGALFGVFDGATDARGTTVEGMAAGRLAALTVAQAANVLLDDPGNRRLPAPDIIAHLSEVLKRRTDPLHLPIPPSTTLALAIDLGDAWRFLCLGDTGIRLNGSEILRHEKVIDEVSTAARVALFRHFDRQSDDPDAVETAARRGILLGLDRAEAEGAITAEFTRDTIRRTIEATGLQDHAGEVETFLKGGICTQHGYANTTGSVLCFDSMNGVMPQLGQWIDEVRPKDTVQSIEIFSDGYPDIPGEVSVQAWEAAFHAAERADFHKTGTFASVKGSTGAEFFDDRTVVVLKGM